MLEYDGTDMSEVIDINKTNASKEYDICHYQRLFNGCHNLMQKAMNFNDIVVDSVKGSDYRIHVWYMSKNDAMNIMKNSDLHEKNGLL